MEVLQSPRMGQELDLEKMRARRKELGLNQTEAANRAEMPGELRSGPQSNAVIEPMSPWKPLPVSPLPLSAMLGT